MLTDDQTNRYSRQIIIKEIGPRGQERLVRSRVLLAGIGGLGSPAAQYLAAAGVGMIGLLDSDVVEASNLNRQILYSSSDIGVPKVKAATARLKALNPDIEVIQYHTRLTSENAGAIIGDYDFIVDGVDNFAAKFLINDACVVAKKPFSHAGVLQFSGQTMTVLPGTSACYRCIFREPPSPGSMQSCAEAGILGSIAGILGTIQATEAIKFLTGAGELLTNSLLTVDGLTMRFRTVALQRQDSCPACGPSCTHQ